MKIRNALMLGTISGLMAFGCAGKKAAGGSQDGGAQDGGNIVTDGGTVIPITHNPRRVILIVADATRADSLNPTDTPNMWALAQQGARFDKHHAAYPTTTMVNAGAIATGSHSSKSSWWGENFYLPSASGNDSKGRPIDYTQVVNARDYATLANINTAYQGQLFTTGTLFKAAKAAGLKTCIIGKPAATYVQNMDFPDYFLDPDTAAPQAFAQELLANGYAIPVNTSILYPSIVFDAGTVDPYAAVKPGFMYDKVTPDPLSAKSVPLQTTAYQNFINIYTNYILPQKKPDLTLLWINEPDATMHAYGPSSPQYKQALAAVDAMVGQVWTQVKALGLDSNTDLILTADHGSLTLSGPLDVFPPRDIIHGFSDGGVSADGGAFSDGGYIATVGPVDVDGGWTNSGQALLAEVLERGGFHAYNSHACFYTPIMSGILFDGTFEFPTLTGSSMVCTGKSYTTPGYIVPAASSLLDDTVLVMDNAAAELLYVPSGNQTVITNLVTFLQKRPEVGPIFVHSKYGDLPGTLPLSSVDLESISGSTGHVGPDIALNFTADETVAIHGVTGITFHNKPNLYRGDHGGLTSLEVHIPGFGVGVDFKAGYVDEVPSANVDLAPTIAQILGLPASAFLANADGRPLSEALVTGQAGGRPDTDYTSASTTRHPTANATGLTISKFGDANGTTPDPTKSSYTMQLNFTTVTVGGKAFKYVDSAAAQRQ